MTKERYRIQGKTYYKNGEEFVRSEDKWLVDEIWQMSNPKGDTFRLMVRLGKNKSFSLYDSNGKHVLKTRSISKIEGK